MHPRAQLNSPRAGSALIGALVIVLAIGGMVTALLVTGMSFNQESDRRVERERCLQLAEAGLAESLTAMRSGLRSSASRMEFSGRFSGRFSKCAPHPPQSS